MSDTYENVLGVIAQVVLFFLMFCFAATIHPKAFYKSLRSKGIFIGIALQLIMMPLIGFVIIKIVPISEASTITFMILLSSPGGAFSNFLNSIFNGDLSLSIAMTTVSTIAALPFLPFNLYLYLDILSTTPEAEGAAERLEWAILGRTVAVLVSGVLLGLYANKKLPTYQKCFYRIANICAFLQIVLAMVTSNNDSPIWEKPLDIFLITLFAVIISLFLAIAATRLVGMPKPEAFSVVIEVAVQNSSVSVAFAFAAFSGSELSEALAIPVVHGVFTTFFCMIFAYYGYKAGWTYSPENETFLTAMAGFYQPNPEDEAEMEKEVADLDEDGGEDGSASEKVTTKQNKGSAISAEQEEEPVVVF